MVYIRTQRQRCIYLLQKVLNIPLSLVPSYFTCKESDWRLVLSSLRVDRMENDEATKISRYGVACLMPPHFLELKFRSLTPISARLILSYSKLFKIPCLKLVLLS